MRIALLNPGSTQLEEIATEAREQGYAFIDRLIKDARSGDNRFDHEGECFIGAYIDETLVACGGVNRDPYTDQWVGRLRHIYVLQQYRRTGVASELVQHLLNQSKATFDTIRLRTSDQNADKFYEGLGFTRTDEADATHVVRL